MTTSPQQSGRALDANAALRPVAGTVVEVLAGEVLVFLELATGRRLPLSTRASGQIVVGFDPSQTGAGLLVTGQMGAMIRETTVEHVLTERAHCVDEWAHALGEAARRGRWATRVVAPDLVGSLRLAPGEAVVPTLEAVPATDHSILGWLAVTAGEARLCGDGAARVTASDGAVPITRGLWLVSDLRCRIERAQAPHDAHGWIRALNLIGRLAAESVCSHDAAAESRDLARRSVADAVTTAEAQEGVDALVGAALGTAAPSRSAPDEQPAALTAAFMAIELAGFDLDDEAGERARLQVRTGRDPFTAAAAAAGVRARVVALPSGWWKQEGPPLVAASRDGQFFCVNWVGRSWSITDPQSPAAPVVDIQATRDRLTGRAWEFVPLLAPRSLRLADLARLALRRSDRDLVVVGLLSVGLAMLAFFTPYILGKVAGAVSTLSSREVVTALVVLTLLLLVNVGWRYVRSVALVRIRTRASTLASGAIWDRMMRLRTTWHDALPLGERMTQSTAVASASAAVPNYVLVDVLDALTVLGGLAAVATASTALLAAVTLMLVLQLAVNVWLTRETARRTFSRVAASAQAQGRLLETLRAVVPLKVYGAESRAFKRWAALQASLTRSDLAVRRIATVQVLTIGTWPVIGLIVLVAVSHFSGASFGDFVTAQAALAIAGTALAATALSSSALMSGRAIVSTLEPVLASVPEADSDGLEVGVLQGDVTFHDITFRYAPGAPAVLDHLSFTVNAGEHLAIVGASGCGKTTLLRVLLGLAEPESGFVTVDGRDVAALNRPSYRRQVGSVLQSSALMPGSIRYNVAMGRDLSTPEIWQALEWAAMTDEVRAMDMGIDTLVADGNGALSSGQRQRILLARALASNPRMLVLDEATSAQDNITQEVISHHLDALRLTRIVIAHRLSTIESADRIVVLEAGRVAQQGTFRELVDQPGHFSELVRRQTI